MTTRSILSLTLALTAALLLSACGGDSGGGTSAGGSGGTTATATPAGTWELDVAAVKPGLQKFFDEQSASAPEAQRAAMKGMIDAMLTAFDDASMSVDIKADGTWTSVSRFPEPPQMTMEEKKQSGTWKLDGDQLTVTTTMTNGEKDEDGDVRTGTFNGDEILVREEGQPFDMVLRRK